MRLRLFLFLNIVLVAATVGIFSAPEAGAYVRWASGCTDCHSDFRDEVSIKPGNVWPDDKHNVHRRSIINDTASDYCGACHVTNGDNPLLNGSRGEPGIPGVGCMGCHGVDPDPGVPNNTWWGSGLRLHHANKNVGPDNGGLVCANCHNDDPAPLGEHSVPIYYGLTDINVRRSGLRRCRLELLVGARDLL
jgi:hypothetical protein